MVDVFCVVCWKQFYFTAWIVIVRCNNINFQVVPWGTSWHQTQNNGFVTYKIIWKRNRNKEALSVKNIAISKFIYCIIYFHHSEHFNVPHSETNCQFQQNCHFIFSWHRNCQRNRWKWVLIRDRLKVGKFSQRSRHALRQSEEIVQFQVLNWFDSSWNCANSALDHRWVTGSVFDCAERCYQGRKWAVKKCNSVTQREKKT